MQEGDRGSQGPVPGPLVDQPDAGPRHRGQGFFDVRDPVSHVVDPLAAPGDEPAHRRVRAERLEQFNVSIADGQHADFYALRANFFRRINL